MAEWLMLQLPRTPESPVHWLLADSDGQALATVQTGTLTEAAAQAPGRRVCALLDSADVLSAEIDLPARGNVRPQQVVAFALEEQLAADIETQHFALGPRAAAGARTAVAVIARDLLTYWLEALGAVGISPEVVCAEDALVPNNPGHSVALLDEAALGVRRAGAQLTVTVPAEALQESLEVALGADVLAGENLLVYVTPPVWQRRSREIEALRERCASLTVQVLNGGVLPLLAPQLAGGGYINLLQGAYGRQAALGAGMGRWRLAATLAVAFIALHVAGQSFEWLQLKHANRELDDSIRTLVRSAVPGDPGTGAVRARAESWLVLAQSRSTANGFLGALGALARALPVVNGAQLRALNFKQGVVNLRLRAGDASSLERLNQSLRANGWQAELTSGNAAAGSYEGQIQMDANGVP
jgi:general secretion pathway protein L